MTIFIRTDLGGFASTIGPYGGASAAAVMRITTQPRLPGCVLGLSINILGGTGCLFDLPFYLGPHVASGTTKSLFDTRPPAFFAVPANRSSFIDMTFAPSALAPLLNTPGTVWFESARAFIILSRHPPRTDRAILVA